VPLELALPKGRLLEQSRQVLARLGVSELSSRRYRYETPSGTLVRLVKMQDVPLLVASGVIDLGVAPDEWIEESGVAVARLARLGWYRARIAVAAPAGADARPAARRGPLRVATEYPALARRLLPPSPAGYRVCRVSGSAEAFPPEHADLIVDCVETGETLGANGLVEVATLLECDVHLIGREGAADGEAGREVLKAFGAL
jgi:ATP phosphoribosyltransferase